MQKFFTNSIESKFIKALLYNTDIPMIDCVVDNDFIFSGYYYIYNNYLILCTETGNLSNNFKIIDNFYFKDKKDNITEKYINKYQYYDSETHLYLGKYLRYLKAEKGIDLMPFYNCFNYTTISNLFIDVDVENNPLYPSDTLHPSNALFPRGYRETIVLAEEGNANVKVLAIPIKYNKEYTICIDANSSVILKPILYANNSLLKQQTGEPYLNNVDTIVYPYSTFRTPIHYKLDISSFDNQSELYSLQNYLYLIIQVPVTNTSSIVVLEGNFTNKQYNQRIINKENIESLSDVEMNEMCISDLSLMCINDNNIYAFSDRLIEYLLLNVITKQDELSKNILNTQLALRQYDTKDLQPGTYTNTLRYNLFDNYIGDKYDITGWLDKDLEKYYMKGIDIN